MTISFRTVETIDQVLTQARTWTGYEGDDTEGWEAWPDYGHGKPGWAYGRIIERAFGSYALVGASPCGNYATIETAWSGFLYTVERRPTGALVTYDGAWNGLLGHDLCPTFTSAADFQWADAPVTTTSVKGVITLAEYLYHRGYRAGDKCPFNVAPVSPAQVKEAKHLARVKRSEAMTERNRARNMVTNAPGFDALLALKTTLPANKHEAARQAREAIDRAQAERAERREAERAKSYLDYTVRPK